MRPAITGLVLAGGQSRRMGQDKALLPYRNGSLLSHAVDALRPLCAPIFILSSHPQHHFPSTTTLPDAYPHTGPMGALLTGLEAMPTSWAAVFACDIPHFPAAFWQTLLEQQALFPDKQAILFSENERLQPLCSLFSRQAIPPLQAAIHAGNLRMIEIIRQLDTHILPANANLAGWTPNAFANWNRPEDRKL